MIAAAQAATRRIVPPTAVYIAPVAATLTARVAMLNSVL